jgi:hypothetical protein
VLSRSPAPPSPRQLRIQTRLKEERAKLEAQVQTTQSDTSTAIPAMLAHVQDFHNRST